MPICVYVYSRGSVFLSMLNLSTRKMTILQKIPYFKLSFNLIMYVCYFNCWSLQLKCVMLRVRYYGRPVSTIPLNTVVSPYKLMNLRCGQSCSLHKGLSKSYTCFGLSHSVSDELKWIPK